MTPDVKAAAERRRQFNENAYADDSDREEYIQSDQFDDDAYRLADAYVATLAADSAEVVTTQLWNLCETAWGIIANAGEGSWKREAAGWQEAAAKWRDRWHAALAVPLTEKGN